MKTEAREIKAAFEKIKARGGHAAIDYYNGSLILRCTRPYNGHPDTWGRGAVPDTYGPDVVRLVEC